MLNALNHYVVTLFLFSRSNADMWAGGHWPLACALFVFIVLGSVDCIPHYRLMRLMRLMRLTRLTRLTGSKFEVHHRGSVTARP